MTHKLFTEELGIPNSSYTFESSDFDNTKKLLTISKINIKNDDPNEPFDIYIDSLRYNDKTYSIEGNDVKLSLNNIKGREGTILIGSIASDISEDLKTINLSINGITGEAAGGTGNSDVDEYLATINKSGGIDIYYDIEFRDDSTYAALSINVAKAMQLEIGTISGIYENIKNAKDFYSVIKDFNGSETSPELYAMIINLTDLGIINEILNGINKQSGQDQSREWMADQATGLIEMFTMSAAAQNSFVSELIASFNKELTLFISGKSEFKVTLKFPEGMDEEKAIQSLRDPNEATFNAIRFGHEDKK